MPGKKYPLHWEQILYQPKQGIILSELALRKAGTSTQDKQ